jgi:hypothetical protein
VAAIDSGCLSTEADREWLLTLFRGPDTEIDSISECSICGFGADRNVPGPTIANGEETRSHRSTRRPVRISFSSLSAPAGNDIAASPSPFDSVTSPFVLLLLLQSEHSAELVNL